MKNNYLTVIGNKSTIALNFNIEKKSPKILGCFSLYLNGQIVGDLENKDTFLLAVYKQLKNVLIKQIDFLELSGLNNRKKLDLILSGSGRYDSTILSLGESFDDYIIRVIRLEDELQFFYLKFTDFDNLILDNSKSVTVKINYYIDIVENFGRQLV